jgi:hypothetical protein
LALLLSESSLPGATAIGWYPSFNAGLLSYELTAEVPAAGEKGSRRRDQQDATQ